MTGYCRTCLTPVLWATTEAGKRLALSPRPDPAGNQAVYRDGTGRWLTRQLAKDQEPFGYERRLMPHVATCTGEPGKATVRPLVPLPENVPISRARRLLSARRGNPSHPERNQ